MTEKVKVTKEQAEAIDEIKDIDYAINIHSFNKRPDSPLADMKTSELARALFAGYEVEPEFKVGDWVYDMQHNKVARIDHRGVDDNRVWVDDEDFNFFAIVNIRHATPEEIAEEKERRWWKDIGRNVKEYEIGDVVTYSNSAGLYEITRVFSEDGVLISNDLADREIDVSVNEIKLVVPYENRLDVKTDE